jgi:hypothetical protein
VPDLGATTLVIIAIALMVGTVVQSVVGIGLALVSAPVITLLAPELMPGSMILLATMLPVVTLAREREDIDWRGLGWSLPARVAGTVAGVWIVASFDARQLGIGIGVVVLVAVLLTARTVVVPITRTSLSVAGAVSGITGTASSIGGPPFALLYQHRPARQIRTTMAVYFLVGAAMSVAGLAVTGEITREELVLAAWMLPALLVGFVVSGPLRRRLDPDVVRPAVLLVSGTSAVVLVVRSLIG